MAKSGVTDEIAAHRALESLPAVWADLAHGRIATHEALDRARPQEPEALVERTARMLTPPTAEQTQARLHALLDACSPKPAEASRSAARPRRWLPAGVAALAAAAAVLLLLVVPREPAEQPFDAEYGLELRRWVAVERGPVERGAEAEAASEVWTYRMDRPIELSLRPGPRVVEVIDVRAFAVRDDGTTIVLPIEPVMKGGGVVEVLGLPRDWGLAPGRWRLTLAVGPPDGLPHAPSEVRTDADAPYDVTSAWISIEERAPEDP
jgi:hypothetical protein